MQKALQSLPWVRKVEVNFEKKQAAVTADPAKYDEKQMLKALAKEGFEAKVLPEEKPKKKT